MTTIFTTLKYANDFSKALDQIDFIDPIGEGINAYGVGFKKVRIADKDGNALSASRLMNVFDYRRNTKINQFDAVRNDEGRHQDIVDQYDLSLWADRVFHLYASESASQKIRRTHFVLDYVIESMIFEWGFDAELWLGYQAGKKELIEKGILASDGRNGYRLVVFKETDPADDEWTQNFLNSLRGFGKRLDAEKKKHPELDKDYDDD